MNKVCLIGLISLTALGLSSFTFASLHTNFGQHTNFLCVVSSDSNLTSLTLPPIEPIPLRGLFESGMTLLLDPGVQHAIGITDSQRKGINEAFASESKQAISLSQSGNENAYLTVEDTCSSSLRNILNDKQETQIEQLAFRGLGINAFKLQSFSDSLKLSDDQAKTIQGLIAEIDLKQNQYDEALAAKLMAIPGIDSAKLTPDQSKALTQAELKAIDSMKAQKDGLDQAKLDAFKTAVSTLTELQKKNLPQ